MICIAWLNTHILTYCITVQHVEIQNSTISHFTLKSQKQGHLMWTIIRFHCHAVSFGFKIKFVSTQLQTGPAFTQNVYTKLLNLPWKLFCHLLSDFPCQWLSFFLFWCPPCSSWTLCSTFLSFSTVFSDFLHFTLGFSFTYTHFIIVYIPGKRFFTLSCAHSGTSSGLLLLTLGLLPHSELSDFHLLTLEHLPVHSGTSF